MQRMQAANAAQQREVSQPSRIGYQTTSISYFISTTPRIAEMNEYVSL
jgi:hypothetical protein